VKAEEVLGGRQLPQSDKGGDMRALKTVFAVAVLLFLIAAAADTQQKQISDSEYIAQVLSAAPEAVAKGAAVVRMDKNGSMRTLRTGDNGFTCMTMGKDGPCQNKSDGRKESVRS
jgi:hypothetical protein